MTRRRLSTVVATVSAGLVLLISSASFAADKPSPTISISLEPSSRPEVADVLAARLTDPDGKPVSEAPVEFWIRSDLLGERYAVLGESPTDSSGVARLPFISHKDRYDVRATFDGDETWGAAEVVAPIEFSSARVVEYEATDPTQLGPLRFVMPRLMGIVLGMIWAALLGLAFFTLRSFKRLRPGGAQD
ncbi:MAG TPA: hypothetical protein VJP05_02225 [Acidimicrobiia bacterium]|nr:hypothetical protein [Acidimicrobiia bacterium]